MPDTITRNIRSGYGKIILAFLLGCVIVLLALGINKTTFRQILNTVNQLSQSDPKITLVNKIFRDVVTLDQLQRTQSLQESPKTYNPFLRESQTLQLRLDTLKLLSSQNPSQVRRIDSMKLILRQRDKLFINYLYLRDNLSANDSLTSQVKELSRKMAGTLLTVDSALVTTEKHVTTTTTERQDTSALSELNKQSFWDKVFGRKRNQNVKQIERLVKEELNVRLDTSALSKEDSIIKLLNQTISSEQSNRLKRRTVLVNRQLQLSKAGNALISQLLSILKDVETETTLQSHQKNEMASQAVDRDIRIMDVILILFITATAFLIYLVFADVARSNRYRKQLIIARDEAEQLGQVKQRFLANMSHELRTPLQTIVGISEQLKMKNGSDKDAGILYQSSQHLLQIINEVLDYTRIVSGRFHFDHKHFNMHQVIDEVKSTIQVQVAKKGLKFVCKEDINPAQYYIGDPFRLKQILYNLLGNAVKFTTEGIIALYVARTEDEANTTFTFTIKDTGIGIAEHDIDRIFSEFETITSAQNSKGTGLGLNIVKALVETQGGFIDVESLQGHGSEFKVILSFAKTETPSTGYQSEGAIQQREFKGKVLVVDDDKFILQLCTNIFEKYGIRYSCFESAEAALAADWDTNTSIALLDIRLPGMNGIDLCRHLKDRTGNATRFVALTAQVMSDEKSQILENGFDDLLTKPFMEQDLIEALGKAAPKVKEQMNISSIIQMAGNDEEVINKILEGFVVETKNDVNEIHNSLKSKNYSSIADTLHRLASRCGQAGAIHLLSELRECEVHIRSGKQLDHIALHVQLNRLCERVILLTQQIHNTYLSKIV